MGFYFNRVVQSHLSISLTVPTVSMFVYLSQKRQHLSRTSWSSLRRSDTPFIKCHSLFIECSQVSQVKWGGKHHRRECVCRLWMSCYGMFQHRFDGLPRNLVPISVLLKAMSTFWLHDDGSMVPVENISSTVWLG